MCIIFYDKNGKETSRLESISFEGMTTEQIIESGYFKDKDKVRKLIQELEKLSKDIEKDKKKTKWVKPHSTCNRFCSCAFIEVDC